MSQEPVIDSNYRGRYAPSPTGRLHLGNLRTALLAWLHARLSKGQFILRIDDLDTPRNKLGSIEEIIADLQWLGLDWDEGPDIGGRYGPYLQSERIDIYDKLFEQLKDTQQVFPCTCSRKDVHLAQSAPNAGQIESIYPGTCRPTGNSPNLPTTHRKPVSWRFLTQNISITSQAVFAQATTVELEKTVGDFVIRRKDGLYAYQFATVVDDGLMGISDIVRGSDLSDSIPRQLALFDALGFSRPYFLHVPLMNDAFGKRMAKRDGSNSLDKWKSEGRTPELLIGKLAYSCKLIETERPISCHELLDRLTFEDLLRNISAAYKPVVAIYPV
ncbi:MAG: tRNA glutamyl-Q(34) synthetase GluQRS [Gammaproteobacteria bacterium]|nr:tRNA glutamyl-Q(34) synthetase GluQRS [Gammaproteobacteria bacterium]